MELSKVVYKFFKWAEQDEVNLLWVKFCLEEVVLSNMVMLDKDVYSKKVELEAMLQLH